MPNYPRLHLLPGGGVLYVGHGTDETPGYETPPLLLAPDFTWQSLPQGGLPSADRRTYGASALMVECDPASGATRSARVLVLGGAADENSDSLASADVIVIDAAGRPVRRERVEAADALRPLLGRRHCNLVCLPDGTVLVCGGVRRGYYHKFVRESLLLTWATGAVDQAAALGPSGRGYHSSAVLLPDGRVLMMGTGNPNVSDTGEPGIPDNTPGYRHLEQYTPGYAAAEVDAARPAIDRLVVLDGAGSQYETNRVWHGAPFYAFTSVQGSQGGGPYQRAVLIRPGSATHGYNSDQRYLDLGCIPGYEQSNAAGFYIPQDPAVAPLGHYLLFLLDQRGAPSLGRWVTVTAETTASLMTS